MAVVHELASFVYHARFEDLSSAALHSLKIRVLDSLGCALGALHAEPIRAIRTAADELGGNPLSTLIGGGKSSPDRAALLNGALVRYLDFNDSYLAPGETCHPSDNLAPVLAACEAADASGRNLLAALAVAYQVHCRLSDAAPVRQRGFDHTTQGAYAVAAGVSKALGLDAEQTAHALAISGTALPALRVTRTGHLSQWKGLAYPHTAFAATHACFLARAGITGPAEVFEGKKGFMESISGPFRIDWAKEDLERVTRTVLKRYNAEVHAQSAIEGVLDLRSQIREADRIEVDTFQVAYDIIGGGAEGDKLSVRTKEEADHSLPYMVAAAFLDGELGPSQYTHERIERSDVQGLLRRVVIRPDPALSARFPSEHPCRIRIGARHIEKSDYEGFHTRPASWEFALAKFDRLGNSLPVDQRREIAHIVSELETRATRELCACLERIGESHGSSV